MTALAARLLDRIGTTGPITLAEFMAECLTHPDHGYYTGRDPLGAAGDFTTAPEISQMFGELVGLWLAQVWMNQGAPASFTLVELGPGRGTLMADILRATARVPGFHAAAQITLIEVSPVFRDRQRQTLDGHDIAWRDSIADLPEEGTPLYLVANEFFDALPIRQFLRSGAGWRERMVGRDGDALAFGLGPETALGALAHRLEDTAEGDLVERTPAAEAQVADIAGRIAASGGAALVIDYGGWGSRGDTLQALRAHEKESPLANPGEADLTAHVDFQALAHAARSAGSVTTPMTPQGVFLERLGITQRAQALARNLAGPALDAHVAAHRRLTHPDEMGDLFKAMALVPKDAPTPPGFAP